MNNIFEIGMLLCFGAAWPFSVYRTWKSRSNDGKSIMFLFVVLTGYISGILFKITANMDYVIILYVFNTLLITLDIILYYRNKISAALSIQTEGIRKM
jgi:hypothetical protein